jgi:two-component system response regulator AlgR
LARQLSPDVVVLDIRMPGLSGIEIAHHLNTFENPPAVIFATAYDEYAIEAFEASAVGYVLKPVRRVRLNQALELAERLSKSVLGAVAKQSGMPECREHVCTRSQGEMKLIPISDVNYFLADQKYVNVFHENGQDLIDDSLKALEEEFADTFVRIHRGALVAVSSIDSLRKTDDGQMQIVLRDRGADDVEGLIVSRRHQTNVKRRLQKG